MLPWTGKHKSSGRNTASIFPHTERQSVSSFVRDSDGEVFVIHIRGMGQQLLKTIVFPNQRIAILAL